MTETVEKIREIDGKQLYYSFLAGAQRIFDHQKILNKINVFPVADADTGTNLASTMRSIMDAIIPTDNLKKQARSEIIETVNKIGEETAWAPFVSKLCLYCDYLDYCPAKPEVVKNYGERVNEIEKDGTLGI